MSTWLKEAVSGAVSSLTASAAASPVLSSALSKANTALQSVQGRLLGHHELSFAVERLQSAAAGSKGPERLALLQHWAELLGERESATLKTVDAAAARPPPPVCYPPPLTSFHEGASSLSFRDVLLRSGAAETLCTRFLTHPQAEGGQEAEAALLRLLLAPLCLGGAAAADALVGGLGELSRALAQLGATEEASHARRELLNLAAAAVTALKAAPSPEAAVDGSPGSAEAAGEESTARALASARARAQALAHSHAALAERSAGAPLAEGSALLRAQGAQLSARLQQLRVASEEVGAQAEQSDSLRAGKLTASDAGAAQLDAQLGALLQRQTELEAELAALHANLARLAAARARAADEREAYAAGSGEALQALRARRLQLREDTQQAQAQAQGVAAAASLLAAAEAVRGQAVALAAQSAQAQAQAASQQHAQALVAHASACAASAGTLLGRLRFCAAGLLDAAAKMAQSQELGMPDVAADVRAARVRLERQYGEAEAALSSMVSQAAALSLEAQAGTGELRARLDASLAHLAAIGREFEARTPPPMLEDKDADAPASVAEERLDPPPVPVAELTHGLDSVELEEPEEIALTDADAIADVQEEERAMP